MAGYSLGDLNFLTDILLVYTEAFYRRDGNPRKVSLHWRDFAEELEKDFELNEQEKNYCITRMLERYRNPNSENAS